MMLMSSRYKWLHASALCTLMALNPMAAQAMDEVEEFTQPDLTGTWYLRIRTATDARVPIIGNTHRWVYIFIA